MLVTIIADASYCPDTRVGGYAFWIACGRGKRGGDGEFKDFVVNSTAAEMMALINGLHEARKHGLVESDDYVILQTDCQAAIDAFIDRRVSITVEESNLVRYFRNMVERFEVAYEFRHVKGHSRVKDSRSYVNRKCDELAYRAMTNARKRILEGQNEV